MSRFALTLLLLPAWWFPPGVVALDDPMRPPQAAQPAQNVRTTPGFTLTSTFITRDERRAVINGKTVRVGDRVADARVEVIEATQVRMRRGDKDIVVRLVPGRVKQPAAPNEQEQQ